VPAQNSILLFSIDVLPRSFAQRALKRKYVGSAAQAAGRLAHSKMLGGEQPQ
jgi:hypothetical protein